MPVSFANSYEEISKLPTPLSVEEIYQYIPTSHRLSSSFPAYVKSQIDTRLLAILDWIYYKNFLISKSLKQEIFFPQKQTETAKNFLRFLNIPFPETISPLALKRLIKNSITIWKNKNTIEGFYLYLRSLYGDFFYCNLEIQRENFYLFNYLNYQRNNPSYYTSSDASILSSYMFSSESTKSLYTIKLKLYSPLSEEDINFIRYAIKFFILFFKDNGNNLIIETV